MKVVIVLVSLVLRSMGQQNQKSLYDILDNSHDVVDIPKDDVDKLNTEKQPLSFAQKLYFTDDSSSSSEEYGISTTPGNDKPVTYKTSEANNDEKDEILEKCYKKTFTPYQKCLKKRTLAKCFLEQADALATCYVKKSTKKTTTTKKPKPNKTKTRTTTENPEPRSKSRKTTTTTEANDDTYEYSTNDEATTVSNVDYSDDYDACADVKYDDDGNLLSPLQKCHRKALCDYNKCVKDNFFGICFVQKAEAFVLCVLGKNAARSKKDIEGHSSTRCLIQ